MKKQENPTIYRYPKKIVENPDGTRLEVDRSLRKNKDVSVIIKIKSISGRTKVVYHLVYNQFGRIIHGPHEEPGSRTTGYQGEISIEEVKEIW